MTGKHDVYAYQDPSCGTFRVRPTVSFGGANGGDAQSGW